MGRVARLHTFDGPTRNLPTVAQSKQPEATFCKKFARSFGESRTLNGMGVREFPVFGCGIADLIWIDFCDEQKPKKLGKAITAFEVKLKNWRQGLGQAYRYSYFADSVYLVLPTEIAVSALKYRLAFEELGIGLYSFSELERSIELLIPSKAVCKSRASRGRAVDALRRDFNLRFLAE